MEFLDRDKFVVSIEKARSKRIPSNYTKLTAAQIAQINRGPFRSGLVAHQEEGIRPACVLPYELYADGKLSQDGTSYALQLTAANQAHGAKSAGAPFNVYLRNLADRAPGAGMMAATYAVKPGDTLTKNIPLSLFADSSYSIEVHGPNGFYRAFKGRRSSRHSVEAGVAYEREDAQLTGNLLARLKVKGEEPIAFRFATTRTSQAR